MSTAEAASGYVQRMVAKETSGYGDYRSALKRIERRYGLPFWTLNNLRIGRAKTVEAGVFQKIRTAYIDQCEKHLERLQHELAVEKAMGSDDTFEDFEREAAELSSKIAQAKAKARMAREKARV